MIDSCIPIEVSGRVDLPKVEKLMSSLQPRITVIIDTISVRDAITSNGVLKSLHACIYEVLN